MKIILATHNLHKHEELLSIAHGILEVEMLPDDFPEIHETGTTLRENALIKARAVYEQLHQPVLADDTGLEVKALGGAPGVYTARYAGENATYQDNCQKLVAKLRNNSVRNASFITVLCYIDPQGKEHFFEGRVEGFITNEFRGLNGFGYDPVFEPIEGNGKTFAEMSSEEKNELSHRGRAMRKFMDFAKNGTD